MIPAFLRHDPIISGGISALWRGGDEISMVTDGFSLGKMLFSMGYKENNKGEQRLPLVKKQISLLVWSAP
jgi:hypothetical protein